mgnify:CR=1 FL=1|jgi:hypothetical protein
MSTAASLRRAVRLEFSRRPSALRYMAGALLPSPGLDPARGFPDLAARWSGCRADPAELADFLRAAGAGPAPASHWPLLFPQTIGFRLQMAILTHPVFPVPIWRVLQVRNHLLQHRPIALGEVLDFETRIATHRVVEKGLEVDLRTTMTSGNLPVWESVNTFYVRGGFGPPGAGSPLAAAPAVAQDVVAQWHMPSNARLRFGQLTGDYNGVHLWSAYARRFGFRAAFFHTQRVLGHCLARLPLAAEDRPRRLDAWLKGPVYYDSDVRLSAAGEADDRTFALFSREEIRPAVVGRIRNMPAPAGLG